MNTMPTGPLFLPQYTSEDEQRLAEIKRLIDAETRNYHARIAAWESERFQIERRAIHRRSGR